MKGNFMLRLGLSVWFFAATIAFNVSPSPSYNFSKPNRNQSDVSLFGFTVNLRKSRVITGAPQAKQNSFATGVVYNCVFKPNTTCSRFDIENTTQTQQQNSGQWLGGSMDGYGGDNDMLVVCAPKRMIGNHERERGVCYLWGSGSEQKSLIIDDKKVEKYSEFGWSVHITKDQKGIVIGDPWRDRYGSVTRSTPAQNVITTADFHSTKSEESWFGYAVTSGNFYGKNQGIQYAASEMNLNLKQESWVKIFKYRTNNQLQTIKILRELKPDSENNFGEYFGYNLLTEDFNADGFTDLVVAAPLHSKTGDHENGAVYVYMNREMTEGSKIFGTKPITLTSPYAGSGRFGMALAEIGDINKDGYNDLAVGAPFEGPGAVYIFLNGPQGLSTTYSQRIVAPTVTGTLPGNMMFGFAISRGVDIDGNDYNDLAIGAPNSDQVFVYRTYPMVSVYPSIKFDEESKTPYVKSFKMKVCLRIVAQKKTGLNIDFYVTFKLDKRIRFTNSIKNEFLVSVEEPSCKDYELSATITNLLPITVEMEVKLKNVVPQDGPFCENCYLTASPKVAKSSLPITTSCTNTSCNIDLQILAKHDTTNLVLGETKTLEISYAIKNTRETAYMTQLLVGVLEGVVLVKSTPSTCKMAKNVTCFIGTSGTLKKNDEVQQTLIFDVSALQINKLEIVANVMGLGRDINPANNIAKTTLSFKEKSTLRIVRSSVNNTIECKEKSKNGIFSHFIDVENEGPSRIRVLEAEFYMPVAIITSSKKQLQLFEMSAESKEKFKMEKIYATVVPPIDPESMEDFNHRNHSKIITCDESDSIVCEAYKFVFRTTLQNEDTLQFQVDIVAHMKNIYQHFLKEKDPILFLPRLVFKKPSEHGDPRELTVIQNYEGTEFKVIETVRAAIWIYTIGVLVGFLVLTIITAICKKAGFFKRDLQKEIKYAKLEQRQSMALQHSLAT